MAGFFNICINWLFLRYYHYSLLLLYYYYYVIIIIIIIMMMMMMMMIIIITEGILVSLLNKLKWFVYFLHRNIMSWTPLLDIVLCEQICEPMQCQKKSVQSSAL